MPAHVPTKKDDPASTSAGPSRSDLAHRIAPDALVSTEIAIPLAAWLRDLGIGRGLFRLHAIVDGKCACGNPECPNVGKHPAQRWGATSTFNPKALDQIFRRYPDSGVGIATGRGLLVLDFDAGRGGIKSLAALERRFPVLSECPRVKTGAVGAARGRHVWMRVEESVFIPSRANALLTYKGVDVRCAGGYAVAPGSMHRSGVRYEWEHAPADVPYLPDQLVALLQERETTREPGGRDRERSRMRLSPRMSGYLTHGIPLDNNGGQRGGICSLSRALLELPMSVEDATDKIWDVVQRSEWSKDPWTQEMVYEIVADIERAERPGLRVKFKFKTPPRKVRREE